MPPYVDERLNSFYHELDGHFGGRATGLKTVPSSDRPTVQ